MTTIRVEVVPISLQSHPNADSLSIVKVYDYPVIVKTSDWENRTIGAYIPVDALVPNTEAFSFLDGHNRIRAKKLRSIFSMGLLVPAPEGAALGDDVASILGVTKYEPPEPISTGGDAAVPPPIFVPEYTDIEHLRRYSHLFTPGEQVVVTEKIHGANGRWLYHDGAFHAGSHHRWLKEGENIWWKVLDENFRNWLEHSFHEGLVAYGEVYGSVQDLRYGFGPGRVDVRLFDVFDTRKGAYLDWSELSGIVNNASLIWGMKPAPTLWQMPFDLDNIINLAEQDSLVGGAGHVMEGVVVRPLKERYDPEVGRVILKLHSQRYLLRKEGK